MRRLKVETEHEAQLFGQGLIIFNLENWYSAPWIIGSALKLMGLYSRARRNADQITIKRNVLEFEGLPAAFADFTILHLSDLHADISEGAMRHLIGVVGNLKYDICVLTGDYRGKTYGPFDGSLESIHKLRAQLRDPLYGVLGNHDSIQMVPALEEMGIRMLFNECEIISRNDSQIYLAGIDDAHFYRTDDIEKGSQTNSGRCVFHFALPHAGGVSRSCKSRVQSNAQWTYPRWTALSSRWDSNQIGVFAYPDHWVRCVATQQNGRLHIRRCGTSVLPARLNCPPEITLHTLRQRK